MICIVFLLALSAAQQATANGTLISVDSTITLVNLVRAPIDTFPTVPYQEVSQFPNGTFMFNYGWNFVSWDAQVMLHLVRGYHFSSQPVASTEELIFGRT